MKKTSKKTIAAVLAVLAAAFAIADVTVDKTTEWWDAPPSWSIWSVIKNAGAIVHDTTNNGIDIGLRKSSTTIGSYSVAEGNNTTASGSYAHAEGNGTTASGSYAHAEGYGTTASGSYSHAEGYNASTSGDRSWVWSGDTATYYGKGTGTFAIDPTGGLAGFYIGSTNLYNHIRNVGGTLGFMKSTAGFHATEAGCTTEYYVTNVNPSTGVPTDNLYGGVRTRNGEDYTSYAHNGVAVHRNGTTVDYNYDETSKGIVRFYDTPFRRDGNGYSFTNEYGTVYMAAEDLSGPVMIVSSGQLDHEHAYNWPGHSVVGSGVVEAVSVTGSGSSRHTYTGTLYPQYFQLSEVVNNASSDYTAFYKDKLRRYIEGKGYIEAIYFPTNAGTIARIEDIPTTMAWMSITGKPTFATVATSGSYADLSNKPTIPSTAADVGALPAVLTNSAYRVTLTNGNHVFFSDEAGGSFIEVEGNGGTITRYSYGCIINGSTVLELPSASGTIARTSDIPTAVSSLTNDAAYITTADVTTELIQQRMGVYLYIGQDGGIYVHTPTPSN